jgi:hypothetical protein
MWGHYARSHTGIVLGIDPSTPSLTRGLKSDGFEVRYTADRSATKLPLAYYQNPAVELYDGYGNLVNDPNDQVLSDGGLYVPFKEYRRQVELAEMTALTTKAQDWHYEQEVRFIYDLNLHAQHLLEGNGHQFVSIPAEAVAEIVVGFQADMKHVHEIVRLFREGKIGTPKLFYSECHPNLFEVQPRETDDQYLLDYFGIILPSM